MFRRMTSCTSWPERNGFLNRAFDDGRAGVFEFDFEALRLFIDGAELARVRAGQRAHPRDVFAGGRALLASTSLLGAAHGVRPIGAIPRQTFPFRLHGPRSRTNEGAPHGVAVLA